MKRQRTHDYCPHCGQYVEVKLSNRGFDCPKCRAHIGVGRFEFFHFATTMMAYMLGGSVVLSVLLLPIVWLDIPLLTVSLMLVGMVYITLTPMRTAYRTVKGHLVPKDKDGNVDFFAKVPLKLPRPYAEDAKQLERQGGISLSADGLNQGDLELYQDDELKGQITQTKKSRR